MPGRSLDDAMHEHVTAILNGREGKDEVAAIYIDQRGTMHDERDLKDRTSNFFFKLE